MTTRDEALPAAPSRMRLWLRRLVVSVVTPYAGICLLLALGQRKLLYGPTHPDSLPAAAVALPDVEASSVLIPTEDGLELHGWHLVSHSAQSGGDGSDGAGEHRTHGRPLVLFFHGNGGDRSWRQDDYVLLTSLGLDVLAIDYRGYGENVGSPSEEGLARDARATWNFATGELGVSPSQIVLYGESLGSGVAVSLAAACCAGGDRPAGMILRSPFSSMTDAAAYHFPWAPVRWILIDRYPSIDRVSAVTCPILIIHGRKDSVVPFEQGQRLFAACPAESSAGVPKRFVDLSDADHNDVLQTAGLAVRDAIDQFLEELNGAIGGARGTR